MDLGWARPVINILSQEIPVGVICNVIQRAGHCYKKKKKTVTLATVCRYSGKIKNGIKHGRIDRATQISQVLTIN